MPVSQSLQKKNTNNVSILNKIELEGNRRQHAWSPDNSKT